MFSYDGSGKRGKDIAFTITASKQTIHTGDLPSDKYEELFDYKNLDNHRLEKLKNNALSKDYYLCPDCERLLAEYLESPYASFLKNGKQISGDIALFFWLSVIWRISITRIFGDWLSSNAEDNLRSYLFLFLNLKQQGLDTSDLLSNNLFNYVLLYNPDYLKQDDGFINFKTNTAHDCAAFICGDIVVFMGKKDCIFDFWGLEKNIEKAPLNNGITPEKSFFIPIEDFVEAKNAIINTLKKKKIEYERNLLDQVWKKLNLKGKMPIELQNEIIFSIHGEELKLGDRGEVKMWAPIIYEKMSNYLKKHSNQLFTNKH